MAGAEYYAAAKAALHGFSRSAMFGFGRDGDILSNVVMAGLTRTDTNTAIITEADGAHYGALALLGRLLDAAEVAGPVVYLGSSANTGITGQVILVNAGGPDRRQVDHRQLQAAARWAAGGEQAGAEHRDQRHHQQRDGEAQPGHRDRVGAGAAGWRRPG